MKKSSPKSTVLGRSCTYLTEIWFIRNIDNTLKYLRFLPCEILTAGILIRMLFSQQKMYIDMDAARNVSKYGLDSSKDDG